ncbi:MAG: ORF6N domain-containing protein [Bacteroidetes bacterium]|nr:ORF6N domain-containing protein [Bacteroidota bacterium]
MNEIQIAEEKLLSSIFVVKEQKVMLDSDLAFLYGVETRTLNQAVKRNFDRFPIDFMFQLSEEEWQNLKSHFVTSRWGGRRKLPYVFTEQGIAMLSSVLNSKRAIQINISIMRVFVKMRQFAANYSELLEKIEEIQKQEGEQNQHIANIYRIIEELVKPELENKNPIGFRIEEE